MSNVNNISLDQARYIILQEYPDRKPVSVADYDIFYIFNLMPRNYEPETDGIVYDSLKAVRKDDGRVLTFNPLYHDSRKYAETVEKSLVILDKVGDYH